MYFIIYAFNVFYYLCIYVLYIYIYISYHLNIYIYIIDDALLIRDKCQNIKKKHVLVDWIYI